MARLKHFIAGFILLWAYHASWATSLDRNALERINAATFEVVVPKPTKDSLSYEKPLPMDLIPYAIRTDKYHSVGTAFAISPDRYVSAAHVMNLGLRSQYKGIYLRDKAGKVYHIDKIIKYSSRKDFVVFSLKNKKANQPLTPSKHLRINEKVYAVGNALGQGVVIRDGLYTSNTPEEREGAWKWIRFSAAASPGNSGGPLLDNDGRVIGIVVRKSDNENLNFALPISEVIGAKEDDAIVDMKIMYHLDNMDMTKIGIFKKSIPLPKSHHDLNRELITSLDHYAEKLIKQLFNENRKNIFPNGQSSTTLLHNTYSAVFPNLIAQGRDGNWDVFAPEKTTGADLGSNGYLTYGALGNTVFFYIEKPDDIPLQKFYKDSKTFMDLILKGVSVTRRIGQEKIRITSLGKAEEEYIFTDSYKRKWQVRKWPLEYNDTKVVTFSLHVPSGYITMMRSAKTGIIESHIIDLKAFTDFIYISYYGTFKQWRAFLNMKHVLPSVFSALGISFNYNDSFKYKSRRISFSYNSDLMKITKDSDLELRFSYFKENGKTIWDVSKLVVGDDKNSGTAIVISRNIRPPKNMSDTYQSEWKNVTNEKYPYNNSSFYNDNRTVIAIVHKKDMQSRKLKSAALLYTVGYTRDGKVGQKTMKEKLNNFMKNLDVYEN